MLMISSILSNSEARPYKTDQELFDGSDMVVVGNIVSKDTDFSSDYISYEIKVERYLKNSQQDNVITAVGHNLSGGLLGNTIFEVGDRGFFYLNNYSQKYDNENLLFISPYSIKITESELENKIAQLFPDYVVPPHDNEGPRGPGMQELAKASDEFLYLILIVGTAVGSAGTVFLIKTRRNKNVKI